MAFWVEIEFWFSSKARIDDPPWIDGATLDYLMLLTLLTLLTGKSVDQIGTGERCIPIEIGIGSPQLTAFVFHHSLSACGIEDANNPARAMILMYPIVCRYGSHKKYFEIINTYRLTGADYTRRSLRNLQNLIREIKVLSQHSRDGLYFQRHFDARRQWNN